MKKKKRRGISMGTVFMLVITLATLVVSLQLIPMLAGQTALKLGDAQTIVSALTNELHLPALQLADIPIFHSGETPPPYDPPAPTLGEIGLPSKETAETATPAPTPTPVPQKRSFTLTAAGSFGLDKAIYQSCYYKESETYDFSPILGHIADAVTGDLKVFTFENLIDSNQKISDLNAPSEAMDAVKEAGFDLAFLGHEKAMNLGLSSLGQTIGALSGQGFSVVGGYDSKADAERQLIMDINGVQVAVLHYTETIADAGQKNIKKEDAAFALPLMKAPIIAADIAAVREKGAQVVIVSLHWGKLNTHTPTKAQTTLAQQLADAGADVILGAHARAIQPVVYLTADRGNGTQSQTLVAYSLGALMTSSRDSVNIAAILLHLNIAYDPATAAVSFEEVSYSPLYFWRYKEDGRNVYEAVLSNREPPESMSSDQIEVMERALKRATDTLKDSCAALR